MAIQRHEEEVRRKETVRAWGPEMELAHKEVELTANAARSLHRLTLVLSNTISVSVATSAGYKIGFRIEKERKKEKKRSGSGSDALRTRTGPFWTEPTVRFSVRQNL